MEKIVAYIEKRASVTKEAYERSRSVQWLRRSQEAELILAEAKRIQKSFTAAK